MKAVLPVFFCILVLLAPFSFATEKHGVAILLDVSRSVSPGEFERIKDQIQELIDQKFSSDTLFLYTFGNQLKRIDPANLSSVRADESYTMFYDAAYDVMQDLAKTEADKKAILIFSDGRDTKSVTTPEDVVAMAREQKIAIHCVGIGNANQKLLERIAKLTGGSFLKGDGPDLVARIKTVLDNQKERDTSGTVQQKPVQAPVQEQAVRAPAIPSTVPSEKKSKPGSYLWIAVLVGTLLAVVGGFLLKRRATNIRVCPTCERPLESSETVCPDCAGGTKILSISDLPSDNAPDTAQNVPTVPPGWLEPKEDTQEILSKTYFLVEKPVLIVTKGTNVGESYPLSKEAPVSIGRSRLNEIRPDDGSISAQHCRIIPENGEYVIYDLGSTNGTIVNNILVNKAVLEEGDTIKVGATTMMFTMQSSS